MDALVDDMVRKPHLPGLALAGTNAAEELENELAAATAVADALKVTDTDAKEESARADKEGGDQGDPKSVESSKVAPAPQAPDSPPDHGNGTAADPSVEVVAPDKVLASKSTKAVQAVNASSSSLQPSPGEPDTPDASESIGQPDSNRTINPSELEGDPGRAVPPAATKAPPPQPSPDSKKASAEVGTALPRAPPKRKGGQTVYDVMVQVRLGREEEVPSARCFWAASDLNGAFFSTRFCRRSREPNSRFRAWGGPSRRFSKTKNRLPSRTRRYEWNR